MDTTDAIEVARSLRMRGDMSLRTIAETVSAVCGFKVSHEWVRQKCEDIPHKDNKKENWIPDPKERAEWRKAWAEGARDKRIQYGRSKRERALEILGDKCVRCGNDDYRVLHIDHIHGGGHKEQKEKGTNYIYGKILRGETEEYQLLCANCHGLKTHKERIQRQKADDDARRGESGYVPWETKPDLNREREARYENNG